MKFPYQRRTFKPSRAFPDERSSLSPIIPVKLSKDQQSVQVDAFLDSGAANCLFPAQLGEMLGISVRSGGDKEFFGIGRGNRIQAYFHDVNLKVGNTTIWVYVGFSYDALRTPLLGQVGFFDHFIVTFDYLHEAIVIRPRSAKQQILSLLRRNS